MLDEYLLKLNHARLLDDILVRYEGYTMERTPIEMVNYHENCPL